MAADKRAGAADQALDDAHEQAGGGDRQKQKPETRRQRREHALRQTRQGRGRQRRETEDDASARDQKPAGLSEIGDLLERAGKPRRPMARPIGRSRINEEHRSGNNSQGDENRGYGGRRQRRGLRARGTRQHAAPLREIAQGAAAERSCEFPGDGKRSRVLDRCRVVGARFRAVHDAPAGWNTAMVMRWPFEMLKPLMRGPAL